MGLTPLRLALAGVAVASFAGAAASGLKILFEERAQGALFALAGSVAGRTWLQAALIAPWILGGVGLALLLAGRVNLLALGEDVARSLGVRTARDTLLLTAVAVLLAAAAVSVAGPIGFIGLMVPHLARALVGNDHRLLLPLCVPLGAATLIWADIAARMIDKPAEVPVGILIAALGAPFFVVVARRLGGAADRSR